jgi:Zn-dependent protease
MFGKKVHLFNLFGFKVNFDISWIILAVLVTWSLASGLFPHYYPKMTDSLYWKMAILGTLGLFASLIFHEFCHSIVARKFGMPMKGITLFIFGGVAEMDEEPPGPKAEFLMAAAGPASSILLAAVVYAIVFAANVMNWPTPIIGVLKYIMWVNLLLAAFNLVPAYPLDGGRLLRSGLWAFKKNITWATRIASAFGSAFGILLIVLGVISFIAGNFVGGLWWLLIGIFVKFASGASYQRLVIHRALGGEPVKKFMKENPVTVPVDTNVDKLVQDYYYKYHYKMFPVVNSHGKLLGCISSAQIKNIPNQQWSDTRVSDIYTSCRDNNSVSPDTDAVKALSKMNSTGNSRLLVVDEGDLAGIITLKDMLAFLSLKIDLEGNDSFDNLQPQKENLNEKL